MKRTTVALALALIGTTADAALLSRSGGQAVFDDDLNVTWLANANLAQSQTFGVAGILGAQGALPAGQMTIPVAENYLAAMNAADYLGADGWQLPSTLSQFSHLYFDELGALPPVITPGGLVGTDLRGDHGPFTNIQGAYLWGLSLGGGGEVFTFTEGFSDDVSNTHPLYVWPILLGDAFQVSEPSAFALLVGGFLALTLRRK